MFLATIRKNILQETRRCQALPVFWRPQTTQPKPLEESEDFRVKNPDMAEVDASQVRSFEDIPGPARGLRSFVEFYRKSEGFAKGHKLSKSLFEKYGPIYKESFSGHTTIHIIDPADTENVFRAQGKYPRSLKPDFWILHRKRRNLYRALVMTDGEEWHRLRQIISPKVMRPKTVEENLDNFNAVANDAVSRFVKLKEACGPDDCIPDLEGELSRFTTESIGTMAFDSRLGVYNDQPPKEALKYIRAIHDYLTLSQKLMFSIPSNLVRPYMDTPTLNKFFKVADVVLEIGNGFVNKKIKELNEQAEKGIEASSDVVPVLAYLQAKEELTQEEKNGLAMELVAGGVHTTANLLLWLLYNLGRLPEIQAKLLQEIDKAVGNEIYITAKHVVKMPYLKACVKESLRFTPTISALTRVLDQDVVLSGYHVPAQTNVIIDLFSACHNENIFKDPSEFRPERWMRENKDEQHAFANLQFGYGVRMCVGRRIAEMEVYLLLCKLLQRFRIEYTNEPLESIQMLILVPDKPVKIKFVDRV